MNSRAIVKFLKKKHFRKSKNMSFEDLKRFAEVHDSKIPKYIPISSVDLIRQEALNNCKIAIGNNVVIRSKTNSDPIALAEDVIRESISTLEVSEDIVKVLLYINDNDEECCSTAEVQLNSILKLITKDFSYSSITEIEKLEDSEKLEEELKDIEQSETYTSDLNENFFLYSYLTRTTYKVKYPTLNSELIDEFCILLKNFNDCFKRFPRENISIDLNLLFEVVENLLRKQILLSDETNSLLFKYVKQRQQQFGEALTIDQKRLCFHVLKHSISNGVIPSLESLNNLLWSSPDKESQEEVLDMIRRLDYIYNADTFEYLFSKAPNSEDLISLLSSMKRNSIVHNFNSFKRVVERLWDFGLEEESKGEINRIKQLIQFLSRNPTVPDK